MAITELRLSGFRCFREEQKARVAPVTLLVGENSTGKTSFLALTRVMWDLVRRDEYPNFKKDPYDLGSFDDIAHYRGGRGGRADEFTAGLTIGSRLRRPREAPHLDVTFRRDGDAPMPAVRCFRRGQSWAEIHVAEDTGAVSLRCKTSSMGEPVEIDYARDGRTYIAGLNPRESELPSLRHLVWLAPQGRGHPRNALSVHEPSVQPDRADDHHVLSDLAIQREVHSLSFFGRSPGLFASAPVRSSPHRTYESSHLIQDAEGGHVPVFLSSLSRRDMNTWTKLKSDLEGFGHRAGLFDEVSIKPLGSKDGGPFQLQVRKFGKLNKGPRRNVVDVGYGVSQVLPVATELLRTHGPRVFLLQQPEVHLHPKAQAALGDLFCNVATRNSQLFVETHSDHLIDRVRMHVRDKKSRLRPEDVSILYFERRNLSVQIYSLGWDAEGNLVARDGSIPEGYREFFRLETRRSLGY